jgi:hypothetical protein
MPVQIMPGWWMIAAILLFMATGVGFGTSVESSEQEAAAKENNDSAAQQPTP